MNIQQVLEIYPEYQPKGSYTPGTRIWVPDPEEVRPCCRRFLRRVSRAYPEVVYNHCKSVEHLAQRYNVSPKELRQALRKGELHESHPSESST
jgi:hypothetical protein